MGKQLSLFEKVLFILSIYVIIELYISSVVDYSENLQFWLNMIDSAICFVFLYDFFKGLKEADDKWRYVRLNWINFISSIPFVGFLRIGRFARIFRLLRIIRSGKIIYSLINKQKPMSTFKNLLLLNVFFIFIISISFYHAERGINPAIQTFSDSFLWSLITTVTFSYYNKIIPLTSEGQVLSVILVLMRMILFGTLIGTITDFFLDKDEADKEKVTLESLDANDDEVMQRMDKLEEQLNRIEKMLNERK